MEKSRENEIKIPLSGFKPMTPWFPVSKESYDPVHCAM